MLGRVLGRSGVGKETRELAKGKQRSGRNALHKWLNCLFNALLIRGDADTLSLWVCISALLLS